MRGEAKYGAIFALHGDLLLPLTSFKEDFLFLCECTNLVPLRLVVTSYADNMKILVNDLFINVVKLNYSMHHFDYISVKNLEVTGL